VTNQDFQSEARRGGGLDTRPDLVFTAILGFFLGRGGGELETEATPEVEATAEDVLEESGSERGKGALLADVEETAEAEELLEEFEETEASCTG